MRSTFLGLSLTLTGVLAACNEASDWRLGPEGTALATRTEHNNDWVVPFAVPDLDNPCTTAIEDIDLEGKIHGQGSQWDNGHFKSHYNTNVTGVDADGVRYQGQSSGNGSGFGGPAEDAVISIVINSLGAYPNFITKIVVHFRKDGTLRVEKGGEECRG